MVLKLYNSLTRKREIFKPLRKKEARMYNCGPTVYSFAHIGNFRSYVFADLLRRYLEHKEYKVKQVMNITDVGHMTSDMDFGQDKMELAAKKEKKTPQQIARFYEKAFHQDVKKLNIRKAHKYPRATEHIKEMLVAIKKLIKNGYGYIKNGSVYFNVTKFKNYGQLSGNTLDKLKAGCRVEVNPDKKNPWDFALWIADRKHIMHWSSPWNNWGYPGWHIECSVMSTKYLGQPFDIHTGGEDNKFPHHECEIAQAEGANKKKFVNYWLHVKHLIVEGQKMSKSKGNFYTLRDLLDKGYKPMAIRYLLLSTHYRQQLNFTFQGLKSAENSINYLEEFLTNLKETKKEKEENSTKISLLINQAKKDFSQALDDDLNISKALAVIFNLIKEVYKISDKQGLSKKEIKEIKQAISQFDQVLGLNLKARKQIIPQEIRKLATEREKARQEKDWTKSDKIRKEIEKKGYLVEDTPKGPRIKKF